MLGEDPIVVVRQPDRRPLHVAVVDRLEIGRNCDGLLIADDRASRRHLELAVTPNGLVAADLGSTNGTYLDGVRLDTATVLRPGATLLLGDTTVQLAAPGDGTGSRTIAIDARTIDVIAAEVDRRHLDPAKLDHDGRTITIAFSDIEGSTQLAAALGDAAWFELLRQHERIVRHRVAEFRGTVVKNQGDGFMVTFSSARNAVRCLIELQRDLARWREEDPPAVVRVRMGAHVAEAIHGPAGDLFGHHVNVAARVAGLAEGGQILVSSLVKQLVETRGDLALGPGRPVQLKGISGTHTVHPVEW